MESKCGLHDCSLLWGSLQAKAQKAGNTGGVYWTPRVEETGMRVGSPEFTEWVSEKRELRGENVLENCRGPSPAEFWSEQACKGTTWKEPPHIRGNSIQPQGACFYQPDCKNVQFIVTGESAQKGLPQWQGIISPSAKNVCPYLVN